MRRFHFGELQRAILEALDEAGMVAVSFLLSGASSKQLFKNLHRLKRRNERLNRSIMALKKRRLIAIRQIGNDTQITLTREGKRELLQYNFQSMRLLPHPRWDGKWRMVIFDIPERYGQARRALSSKIRQIGALPLQKSVFIYPFPWRNEVDFIGEFFDISAYIRYIEATFVEGEDELRQKFHL